MPRHEEAQTWKNPKGKATGFAQYTWEGANRALTDDAVRGWRCEGAKKTASSAEKEMAAMMGGAKGVWAAVECRLSKGRLKKGKQARGRM